MSTSCPTLAQHFCVVASDLRDYNDSEKPLVLNCPYPASFQYYFKTNWRQLLRSWYMFFFQILWLPEFGMRLNMWLFIEKVFRRGMALRKKIFSDDALQKYAEVLQKPGVLTAAINY